MLPLARRAGAVRCVGVLGWRKHGRQQANPIIDQLAGSTTRPADCGEAVGPAALHACGGLHVHAQPVAVHQAAAVRPGYLLCVQLLLQLQLPHRRCLCPSMLCPAQLSSHG